MATVIFIAKDELGHIVGTDEATSEWLRKLPRGEIVKGTMVRPRNAAFHRKLMKCAAIIAENAPFKASARQIVAQYQAFAGLGDTFRGKHGTVFMPKSIAFDAMKQDAFDELYSGFVDWVCEHVIPGLSRFDLEQEVENDLRRFAA